MFVPALSLRAKSESAVGQILGKVEKYTQSFEARLFYREGDFNTSTAKYPMYISLLHYICKNQRRHINIIINLGWPKFTLVDIINYKSTHQEQLAREA